MVSCNRKVYLEVAEYVENRERSENVEVGFRTRRPILLFEIQAIYMPEFQERLQSQIRIPRKGMF